MREAGDDEAQYLDEDFLTALEVVGVLCVELFLTRDDQLLVNEVAPRPHNSGHYTIDACVTTAFCSALRNGAGASSTSFWCRRCRVQSRVEMTAVFPCESARHCVSMCRACSI